MLNLSINKLEGACLVAPGLHNKNSIEDRSLRTGNIPPEIGQLTNLQSLSLAGNAFSGAA